MTLKQAFENIEFNAALNTLDFSTAFFYLGNPEEREKLFLCIQEEGYNPLNGFITIPAYFLGGCRNLTSVEIPKTVTRIGETAFSSCSSLTSIEIPDSVTSIGYRAFYNCSSLTSIEIPDSVTSYGSDAFRDCDRLTEIIIGDSVTRVGESVFSRCENLRNIIFKGTKVQWEAIKNHIIDDILHLKIICSDGVME